MTGARPGFRPPQMAREIKQWYRTRAELDKIYHIRGEKNHYISIATVARARTAWRAGGGGEAKQDRGREARFFVALSVTLVLLVFECSEGLLGRAGGVGGVGGSWGCETLEPAPSPKKKTLGWSPHAPRDGESVQQETPRRLFKALTAN